MHATSFSFKKVRKKQKAHLALGEVCIMENLFSVVLSIKMSQFIVMLILSTVAFIYGMTRTALLINFAFAFYWGFFENIDYFFGSNLETLNQAAGLYFAFGVIIFILFLLAFFVHQY